MKTKYKVAAINASPVFLDLDATVSKAVKIIEDAAREGAELIGFPEAYFPGYPFWLWVTKTGDWDKFNFLMYKNAVTIPGRAVSRLSEAARKNHIHVCASVTELDGGSLYLTQLWFDANGNLIGKHRKIKPTNVERCIWGDGDGGTMTVFETELGRVGGLHCWEHMMPLNQYAMAAQNEQLHVAAWGSSFWDPNSAHHWNTYRLATKYYSMVVGCFSILSAAPMTEEAVKFVSEGDPSKEGQFRPGFAGGGCIYNPEGQLIVEPLDSDKEGIRIAEIDLEETYLHHFQLDIAGHYSKPADLSVVFDRRSKPAVKIIGEPADNRISYEELQSIEQ